MGFLSEETIRRKKRFSGDLVSFMKRHGLRGVATARILGVGKNSVSAWVTRRSGPYLSDLKPLREKMKAYDASHPVGQQTIFDGEEVHNVRPIITGQLAGVKLTLEGGDGGPTKIAFEAQITMDVAREIIRLYTERS